MKTVKEKAAEAFVALKGTQGYENVMQAPKVTKVIISVGVGSFKDKTRFALVEDRLRKITGQAPAKKGAKQSVAAFKVRQGDTVGYQITLRGARMWSFLEKLFSIALPRTKDFRGIATTGIDEMGNYTLGIKEHSIFPETSDEDIRDVFGLGVTIVTTAKSREEARAFFDQLGMPFKKEGQSR